jgi:hypothetical protein
MLIQSLKSEIILPNKITITHTLKNITHLLLILEILQLPPVQQLFNFHSCDIIINVLFLYKNGLTLFHQCTTIVTQQYLIQIHKTIQMLKIEGASNNEARDCIF